MKFRKLQIEDKDPMWFLILDNTIDLLKYLSHDKNQFEEVLFSMRKKDDEYGNVRLDHLFSSKEVILKTIITSHILGTQEEIEIYPHQIINEIIQGKGKAIAHHIIFNGAIQININGGWSGVEIWNKLWKPIIIEEIEKDDVIFPSDSKPIEAKWLILENSGKVPDSLTAALKPYGLIDLWPERIHIKLLKDKDIKWIIESIKLSTNIAFQTEALDMLQIDNFMKLFTTLESKNIYIKIVDKQIIENHSLFNLNNSIHKIIFL